VSALPVQGTIGLVVDGKVLILHVHQLYHLPDGFCFCFGLGFGFRCESLASKEGIRKVKQLLEAEGRSWLLVGTLIKEVGEERGAVVNMKAFPEKHIAFPLGHASVEEERVA